MNFIRRAQSGRLQCVDARRRKDQTHASMQISNVAGGLRTVTLATVVAGESGRQKTETASSMGSGRAICENTIIMQILPGSSRDPIFINALAAICKLARLTSP
jgi:hypothetical protein